MVYSRRDRTSGTVFFLIPIILAVFLISPDAGAGESRAGPVAFAMQEKSEARFAGLVCVPLPQAQLSEIADIYGEECGVLVREVSKESWAAASGVLAGDILISVKMPEDDEFYPIPPDFFGMAQFAEETEPVAGIQLLIYRRHGGTLERMELSLGPEGKSPRETEETRPAEEDAEQGPGMSSGSFSFVSTDPEKVLSQAGDGSPLTRFDVDIFGGVMAWAFGTRLSEAQKQSILAALIEFWPQGTAQDVRNFRMGILAFPDLMPKLPPEKREEMRRASAQVFLQMAQSMGRHPLARVIREVSAGARNVLAGAGTEAELTLQDAHALLEYTAFTTQIQTGQPVILQPRQRDEFVAQVKTYFEKAPAREKIILASMDELWAVLRARWAAAEAARQQALIRQWQQAYTAPQTGGWQTPFQSGWQGTSGGGEMSDSQFDTLLSSMNTLHESSLQTLGAIDSQYDFSVYDSAGQWLYDY